VLLVGQVQSDVVVWALYGCGSWKVLEGNACHQLIERFEGVHVVVGAVVVGDVMGIARGTVQVGWH